ncbi:MAG: DUF5671 domain-containing protein [Acidimicrobiia bacterium]
MSIILGLLAPLLLVAAIIVIIKAFSGKEQERSEGGDLVAYGLLAIFVGGLVWALFLLGRAAFPGDGLVGTSRGDLAGALAGLIVAAPLTYYLWRRQDERRTEFPGSVGWPLYLALTDAIYLTWLVVYGVLIVAAILGDNDFPRLTDVLIVAGVVGIHEWASRSDRPGSNISQIHRVVGSFIGLVTLTVGSAILLYSLFATVYGTFYASAGDPLYEVGVGMTVVGAAVWAWRWLQTWPAEPDGTRLTYLVLITYSAMVSLVGSVTAVTIFVATYLLDRPASPGSHFEPLTALLPAAIVSGMVWWHHRPKLGAERTDSQRSYEYLLMATGLGFAIGFGTALVAIITETDPLVDNLATVAVSLVLATAAAALLWWLFWTNAQEAPRAPEAASFPRRLYLMGMAIILGLTAAGAIVGALLFIFQALFGLSPEVSTLIIELTLAVLAGGAAYHLYTNYKSDSGLRSEAKGEPYSLTVITSHPGSLASALPPEAKLKVIHRGDAIGSIDEEMAARIVEATRGVDSVVWVGENGFDSAPTLKS